MSGVLLVCTNSAPIGTDSSYRWAIGADSVAPSVPSNCQEAQPNFDSPVRWLCGFSTHFEKERTGRVTPPTLKPPQIQTNDRKPAHPQPGRY